MKRAFGAARLRGACAFVLLLTGLLSMPVAATDVDDIGRAVYAAVFEGVAPAAGVGGASPEYRLFRQRYGKTELTADPESGDWEESVAQNKRRSVERLVFAFGAGRSTAVRVSRSIPLALDVAVRDGRIQRGHTLLLEGFGGGFTWGATLLKY